MIYPDPKAESHDPDAWGQPRVLQRREEKGCSLIHVLPINFPSHSPPPPRDEDLKRQVHLQARLGPRGAALGLCQRHKTAESVLHLQSDTRHSLRLSCCSDLCFSPEFFGGFVHPIPEPVGCSPISVTH